MKIPSVHEGIPVPAYLPESDDLIAARLAEMASKQTDQEEDSDDRDLIKDMCWWFGKHDHRCIPFGLKERYSHLYDAPSGSSAEVAR